MLPWIFCRKGASGFSGASTADEVTQGLSAAGLTAIVTGASSGIGVETARVLAARGTHVIMASRNVAAADSVRQAVLADNPAATIDVMELDLSSMASVHKFAADFIARGLPLNILVNNAGMLSFPFTLSKDGIEIHFATNHLGHFLLTHLLLETMKKTSRESNVEGRIVNVSSEGHRFIYKEGIQFDKINDEVEYGTPAEAYGQSKLANILHANELARRFKEEGVNITANSLHPGSIVTNLVSYRGIIDAVKNVLTVLSYVILYRTPGLLVVKNANQGAATSCYLALHPGAKGVSGKYFYDSNVYEPSEKGKDVELAKKLWDFSVELTS